MSSSSNSLAGIANVIIFLIISVFVILYSLRYLYLWCLRRRMIRRRNNQLIIAIEASQLSSLDLPKNGLDPSVIAALPTFVYKKPEEEIDGTDTDTGTGTGTGTDTSIGTTECSICLSTMEEEELVRLLPNCLHLFHAECIDMWLNSHTTCPICRAAVAPPEPEQEPDEAQTDGTGDEVAPPTSPPLEPLNSMTTSSEGASDETAESSKVVDASSSRPIYFHKILSWNRSGRRIQHLEISADGVEDLEKQ